MEPIAKAAIAVFGGNGDCGFLKSFQCLKKSRPVADGHFSIESEKTEHGFTVNYAKYEYVEWMDVSLPDLRFNRNDIPTRFTFIEFATWDDAMKAMWDGFSLGFTAFICTFFPDRDPEEAYDQMGRHITKHESIMAGTKGHKGTILVVIVDKDVYSSDGDPKAIVTRASQDNEGSFGRRCGPCEQNRHFMVKQDGKLVAFAVFENRSSVICMYFVVFHILWAWPLGQSD